MNNFLFLVIIAIIGGIIVGLQAQMIGLLDQKIGTIESVFITYGSGAVVIALVMIVVRGGNLGAWQRAPWYAFGAGLMGLVIIAALSYSVPRLGLVTAFTVFVAAQFVVGALFDHFGLLGAALRPISVSQLIGIGVLLLGVWLILR
jgi:transporter family-2 protein